MEAITQPSTGVPSVLLPLNLVHVLLRINGRLVKYWVRIVKGANDFAGVNGLRRVQ